MSVMSAATGCTMRIDDRAWRWAEGSEKSVFCSDANSFSACTCQQSSCACVRAHTLFSVAAKRIERTRVVSDHRAFAS